MSDDRETLLDLIADFADPYPCRFDHHGYCQEHAWLTTESRCPHARAVELLREARPDHDAG